jgi:hypothetical protein
MSDIDWKVINTVRVLAADTVEKAKSGHPGAPMGCAPMAHVLWSKFMRHNPANPKWVRVIRLPPLCSRFTIPAPAANACPWPPLRARFLARRSSFVQRLATRFRALRAAFRRRLSLAVHGAHLPAPVLCSLLTPSFV